MREHAWRISRFGDRVGVRLERQERVPREGPDLALPAPMIRGAVQVTTDLPGFWVRHYPAIRKELARRYPRHAWPDEPATE